MKNSDMPAMPIFNDNGFCGVDSQVLGSTVGLTKREYFAAMAMQGFCSNPRAEPPVHFRNLAEDSASMANALLAALEEDK